MRLQAFYELETDKSATEIPVFKSDRRTRNLQMDGYNGDGIQQLDEFEIAEYSDLAQYIRVYTNTVKIHLPTKINCNFRFPVNPYICFNSVISF